MQKRSAPTVITLLHIAFFAACGFLSAFVFYSEGEWLPILFPGLLYTTITMLVFIINRIKIRPEHALIYYFLMVVVYMAVFCFTTMLYAVLYFLGPVFCGAGAIASFELTSRFITKMKYNTTAVFFSGALGFAINVILLIGPVENFIKPVYVLEHSFNSLFAPSFLFWQLIVGTKLYFTLQKNRLQQSN